MSSGMFKALLLGAAALTLVSCTPEAPTGSLSADQRREVEHLIGVYLRDNPQVVETAMSQLARRAHESDERDFALGPEDAPVTIVEYFAYNCPVCHVSTDWLFETVKRNPDKIRIIFKEWPVRGPDSLEAAQAALAAQRQGKYLEMHRGLMRHKGDLSTAAINEVARRAGVDVVRMRRDMNDDALMSHLAANVEAGQRAGLEGTPAFLVNGQWVRGFDPPTLERLVKDGLKGV